MKEKEGKHEEKLTVWINHLTSMVIISQYFPLIKKNQAQYWDHMFYIYYIILCTMCKKSFTIFIQCKQVIGTL